MLWRCYICTFVHAVRDYLYNCNGLFLNRICWYAQLHTFSMLLCTRRLPQSVGNTCMNDYFRSRGLWGNPKKSLEDQDTCQRGIGDYTVCIVSHTSLTKTGFHAFHPTVFKSEITQQFFVKFCGKTLHDCLASLSLLLTFLLAVVPFCVACCHCLYWASLVAVVPCYCLLSLMFLASQLAVIPCCCLLSLMFLASLLAVVLCCCFLSLMFLASLLSVIPCCCLLSLMFLASLLAVVFFCCLLPLKFLASLLAVVPCSFLLPLLLLLSLIAVVPCYAFYFWCFWHPCFLLFPALACCPLIFLASLLIVIGCCCLFASLLCQLFLLLLASLLTLASLL